MKFEVVRTSIRWKVEEAPCPEAEKLPNGIWQVEIASLEDLIAFVREHGEVVINAGLHRPIIEIYDDYRE